MIAPSLPWSVQVEEYEPGVGTIEIPEINRLLHDDDWADSDDWERDLVIAELIVNAVNSHHDLLAACVEFVRKVDAGEARSNASYQQMKAAIAKAEGG